MVASDGPGVGGRLRALRAVRTFSDALDVWWAPPTPDDALDDLIAAAARVLAARDDAPIAFCHAVTAPSAIRMVLPMLPPALQRASVAASWQVVAAVIAAFASPRLEAERLTVETDPAPLLLELPGAAIEHGD